MKRLQIERKSADQHVADCIRTGLLDCLPPEDRDALLSDEEVIEKIMAVLILEQTMGLSPLPKLRRVDICLAIWVVSGEGKVFLNEADDRAAAEGKSCYADLWVEQCKLKCSQGVSLPQQALGLRCNATLLQHQGCEAFFGWLDRFTDGAERFRDGLEKWREYVI